MIHIGNQTSFAASAPTQPFDYAIGNGFDAFEWFPDKHGSAGWDEADLNLDLRRRVCAEACGRGMRISLHARSQANPLQAETAAWLWKDIDLAKQLGAVLVNIHLCHEQGLPAFVAALQPLMEHTAERGLELAIENTPLHSPEVFNELFARIGALSSTPTGHVGMCFDLGHANLCAATRDRYLDFVDRLDPQVPIVHVHLHENWGDHDSHLTLFTGPAARDPSGIQGLLDRLQHRDFSGSMILEQWPEPRSLLNQARDRLYGLLSNYGSYSEKGETEPAWTRSPVRPRSLRMPNDRQFLDELVEGNKRARSWREKLELIHRLLADETSRPTDDQFAYLAIYLRFVGTGQIACEEDGRHFRPSHHARITNRILERLAHWATGDNTLILRRIYPWLPSTAQPFQRAEPLTRIRDIAHRNDIPAELKREIKESLQNKLHRCAGPEDLETSKVLLHRVTAPGVNYSPAFVEQFLIFHEELKEFFNARSLEERLRARLPQAKDDESAMIQELLNNKDAGDLQGQQRALEALTQLRERLSKLGPEPELMLLDIALEEFAFVLLSQTINSLPEDLAGHWRPGLTALLASVENLGLSGLEPAECGALASEFRCWLAGLDETDSTHFLRLKASVDRTRRLADRCGERINALFCAKADELGHVLGVRQSALRVYSEGEIRGHLVFQLSKLASNLLHRLRLQLNLPPWDVLISGESAGRVIVCDRLSTADPEQLRGAVVVLRQALGDEEIPGGVAAIFLSHSLPHLSHLGVRARQAGTLLIACEEPAEFQNLEAMQGQWIRVQATPEQVSWRQASPEQAALAVSKSAPPAIPPVHLSLASALVPLAQVSTETAGSKASGLRRLAEMARSGPTLWQVPDALVIPFGIMEAALALNPKLEREYRDLLCKLESSGSRPELEAILSRLRQLTQQIAVPEGVLNGIESSFGPSGHFIVRSSSNLEDLAALSGAGLYESVANVRPMDLEPAVQRVWASLWTERAALSRREAGIPDSIAHMAVIVQRQLRAELAFVMHTTNPVKLDPNELCLELVVGLGETLVSGAARGYPYRILYKKDSQEVRTVAFANCSQALWPEPDSGIRSETIDYSRVPLSREREVREQLARRLGHIGCEIAGKLGSAQDIEGAVMGEEVFLVQSRAQQGVRPEPSRA